MAVLADGGIEIETTLLLLASTKDLSRKEIMWGNIQYCVRLFLLLLFLLNVYMYGVSRNYPNLRWWERYLKKAGFSLKYKWSFFLNFDTCVQQRTRYTGLDTWQTSGKVSPIQWTPSSAFARYFEHSSTEKKGRIERIKTKLRWIVVFVWTVNRRAAHARHDSDFRAIFVCNEKITIYKDSHF